MLLKRYLFILFYFILSYSGNAQGQFTISNGKSSTSIPFTLVNNLVVIPVEINGRELSFLLDTGVNKTLLFNIVVSDSLQLKNLEQINVRGLGEGSALVAYKSSNNLLRIKDIVGVNKMVYMIMNTQFDLSSKMGVDVHGIIGGDFFKDFVVKTNYVTKRLIIYKPDTYKYDKCNNCISLPLEFYKGKPLINITVQNHLSNNIDVKLLIDSGAGDALWLFKNTHDKIEVPDNHFDDFLGKGLSGNIFGKRSLIEKLKIGTFEFEKASVAYPDSTSIITIHDQLSRNGTLGAEILKRFHVVFDYENKKITFKKNKFYYNAPFTYNKSGLEVVYKGDMLTREKTSRFVGYDVNNDDRKNPLVTEIMSTYYMAYKPSYSISYVRYNSPAHLAGLLVGDEIITINNQPVKDKKLAEIVKIFTGKSNKKIRLTVLRNEELLKYEFVLKDLL